MTSESAWKLEIKTSLSLFSVKENKFVTVIYDNFTNTEKTDNTFLSRKSKSFSRQRSSPGIGVTLECKGALYDQSDLVCIVCLGRSVPILRIITVRGNVTAFSS